MERQWSNRIAITSSRLDARERVGFEIFMREPCYGYGYRTGCFNLVLLNGYHDNSDFFLEMSTASLSECLNECHSRFRLLMVHESWSMGNYYDSNCFDSIIFASIKASIECSCRGLEYNYVERKCWLRKVKERNEVWEPYNDEDEFLNTGCDVPMRMDFLCVE